MYINNYKTHKAKYGIHTELIGEVFGKLTVICDSGLRDHRNSVLWECKCECGNMCLAPTSKLKGTLGNRKVSCGHCYEAKIPGKAESLRHYSRAGHILRRCNDTKCKDYKNYGGRGIKCLLGKTPREVAENLELVPGYFIGAQIDRIDNDGNYTLDHPDYGRNVWYDEYGHPCVGNLRWVTPTENRANRRAIALKEISYENLATKRRELRDLKRIFARHQFDYDEFFIKFFYNPKSMKFDAVAIHESIINKYILNDYPNME